MACDFQSPNARQCSSRFHPPKSLTIGARLAPTPSNIPYIDLRPQLWVHWKKSTSKVPSQKRIDSTCFASADRYTSDRVSSIESQLISIGNRTLWVTHTAWAPQFCPAPSLCQQCCQVWSFAPYFLFLSGLCWLDLESIYLLLCRCFDQYYLLHSARSLYFTIWTQKVRGWAPWRTRRDICDLVRCRRSEREVFPTFHTSKKFLLSWMAWSLRLLFEPQSKLFPLP